MQSGITFDTQMKIALYLDLFIFTSNQSNSQTFDYINFMKYKVGPDK